jgi:predicted transcriptional regulator
MRATHTPIRNVRVPDDLWEAAQEAAEAKGTTVSAVIVAALRRFVARA